MTSAQEISLTEIKCFQCSRNNRARRCRGPEKKSSSSELTRSFLRSVTVLCARSKGTIQGVPVNSARKSRLSGASIGLLTQADAKVVILRLKRGHKITNLHALVGTKNEKPTGDRPWYAIRQVDIDSRKYDEKEETQARKISIIQH
ncbi:hypothetical protein DBV15_04301 [Temnothorax longispinosus]|uniref:Uncharacterized protein n=1 Tax=Temnothorax longispinosus TaxID=300112 RepID=A0A4S2KTT1_9HYME|nr:hypothetical protein DBV15_04301 [Temnothorax longispinosus]